MYCAFIKIHAVTASKRNLSRSHSLIKKKKQLAIDLASLFLDWICLEYWKIHNKKLGAWAAKIR